MKAIAYLRVSTDEQAHSGLGLEAQRAAIAAAEKRLGLELVAHRSDEGLSGSLPPLERPALTSAIAELGRGDVLVVAKRDRLGRDLLHLLLLERELEERGIRIVSAAGEGTENDEPSSRLMRRILDAFAQYELDMIRDRTTKGLRAARARGDRAGTVPFGYTAAPDGKLVESAEERGALEIMRARRVEGWSYQAIAGELTQLGKIPRGKRWWPESVRTILATDAKARRTS